MNTLRLTCNKTITLRKEDIELNHLAHQLCGHVSDIDVYRRGLRQMIEEQQDKKGLTNEKS